MTLRGCKRRDWRGYTFEIYAAIGVDVDFIDLKRLDVRPESCIKSFKAYHVLQFRIGWVLAKGLHDFTEFLSRDRACTMMMSVCGLPTDWDVAVWLSTIASIQGCIGFTQG